MPTRSRWRDLAPGLLLAGGIVVLAGVILVFGRVGRLHGESFRINAVMDGARGLMKGSEVWLEGQKVGRVEDIVFLAAETPRDERVLVRMEVLEPFRQHIRLDSPVQVRPGATLIGAPVVYVSSGTPRVRAVVEHDTLRALLRTDFEDAGSRMAGAAQELPAILANVQLVREQLRGARGTLGALGVEGLGPEADEARLRVARLGAQLGSRRGTVGRALDGDDVQRRVGAVMQRVAALRAVVADSTRGLGRIRSDSTLLREVEELRAEIGELRALLASGDGSLGRLSSDSAIVNAVAEAQREMARLFGDIRRNPARYIRF